MLHVALSFIVHDPRGIMELPTATQTLNRHTNTQPPHSSQRASGGPHRVREMSRSASLKMYRCIAISDCTTAASAGHLLQRSHLIAVEDRVLQDGAFTSDPFGELQINRVEQLLCIRCCGPGMGSKHTEDIVYMSCRGCFIE